MMDIPKPPYCPRPFDTSRGVPSLGYQMLTGMKARELPGLSRYVRRRDSIGVLPRPSSVPPFIIVSYCAGEASD